MTARTTTRFECEGSPVKYDAALAELINQCVPPNTTKRILVATLRFERQDGKVLRTSLIMKGVRISVSFVHGGDVSMLGKKMAYLVDKRDACHAVATLLTIEQTRDLRKFCNAMKHRDDRNLLINVCRREVIFLRDVTHAEVTKITGTAEQPKATTPAPQVKPELSLEALTTFVTRAMRLYEALGFPELEGLDDSEVVAEVRRAKREKSLAKGRNQPRRKRPTRARLRGAHKRTSPQVDARPIEQETIVASSAPTQSGVKCERLTYSPFANLAQTAVL